MSSLIVDPGLASISIPPVAAPQIGSPLFQSQAVVPLSYIAGIMDRIDSGRILNYVIRTLENLRSIKLSQHKVGDSLSNNGSLIGRIGMLWYIFGSGNILQASALLNPSEWTPELKMWLTMAGVVTALLWTFRKSENMVLRSVVAQMLALQILLTFAEPPWLLYLVRFQWSYWWPYGLISAMVAISVFPVHYFGDRLLGRLAGAKVGSLGPKGLKKHTLGQRIAYLSGGPILNLAVASFAYLILMYVTGPKVDDFSIAAWVNEIFALNFMVGMGALMPISPRAGGGLILRLMVKWILQSRGNPPKGWTGSGNKWSKGNSRGRRTRGIFNRHQRLTLQAA